jgi:hypothetical protein
MPAGLPRVFDSKKKQQSNKRGKNPVSYYSQHTYIAVIDNLITDCVAYNKIKFYSVDSSFYNFNNRNITFSHATVQVLNVSLCYPKLDCRFHGQIY